MSTAKVKSPRLASLDLLESVLQGGLNLSESELEITWGDPRDRAFAYHLAYGVLRWMTALEWLASQLLKRPLRHKDRDIHRLVLLGLFQLWKDDSAPHAAIHENAECARKLGKPWAVALINAVLRRFQREQDQWLSRLDKQDEQFAHPTWLLRALKIDWPDKWQDIAIANNQAGPLWLRLNRRKEIPRTLEQISASGFSVERHPLAPDAIKLVPPSTITSLTAFKQGGISVQDPAAQLAAKLLDARGHHRVLDACAAPGGKSCHILENAPGVTLTILDQSPTRMERVSANLERLGLGDDEHVQLIAADAARPETWWEGIQYDRILLDAPCSATGVIRRHPEIKWLRSSKQVEKAVLLQARLLKSLWPLLKSGGILLYSTCSVLKAENSNQIQSFMKRNPDAEIIGIENDWGQESQYGRQILPGELEMDGFFYARLRKNP